MTGLTRRALSNGSFRMVIGSDSKCSHAKNANHHATHFSGKRRTLRMIWIGRFPKLELCFTCSAARCGKTTDWVRNPLQVTDRRVHARHEEYKIDAFSLCSTAIAKENQTTRSQQLVCNRCIAAVVIDLLAG